MTELNFGDRVKCPVTGFAGEVFGITNYKYGCRRITVLGSTLGSDGKPVYETFDEPQLEVVKAAIEKAASKPTGGPRGAVASRPGPVR